MCALSVKGINGGGRLKAKLEQLAAQRSEHVRVGVLEGASYLDGTPVALVAGAQEFGVPEHGLPARPVWRLTVKARLSEWKNFLQAEYVHSGHNLNKTLGRTGLLMRDDFVQGFDTIDRPPLAPATLLRKGFAKLLYETGQLTRSIDYEVKNGATESE